MICPPCGAEMTLDSHRRMDMCMCYECGYIEGRNTGAAPAKKELTNFERLNGLNFNETVAFVARGLGVDEHAIAAWMNSRFA